MKSPKMIKVLNSIPKFQIYSHYGVCLDRIFKKNSLKNLIETLKFNEKYKRKYLNEEALFMSTCEKEKQLEEDFFSNINKKKEEEDIFSTTKIEKKPIKLYEFSKTKNGSFLFHRKNSNSDLENLDPFRYTPNYNAISKKVPCVRMCKPISLNKRNVELKNSQNHNKFIRSHILREKNISLNMQKSEEKINNSKENHSNNKSNKYKSTLLTEIDHSKKKIKTKSEIPTINSVKSKFKFRNNKLKKFPAIKKPLNLKSKICLTEIESEKMLKGGKLTSTCGVSFYKKNKAIDFKKMQSRSYKGLNKHSITTPTPDAGFYNPKYDYILERPVNVFINKSPMNKYKFKKIKLNKILTSYHIETNYNIIDNSKLNNEILKEYNI